MTPNSYFIFHYLPALVERLANEKPESFFESFEAHFSPSNIQKKLYCDELRCCNLNELQFCQKVVDDSRYLIIRFPQQQDMDIVYADRGVVVQQNDGTISYYTVEENEFSKKFMLCRVSTDKHSITKSSWKTIPSDEEVIKGIVEVNTLSNFKIPEGVDALQMLRDKLAGK